MDNHRFTSEKLLGLTTDCVLVGLLIVDRINKRARSNVIGNIVCQSAQFP